jgi:hypothetical protein
MKVEYSQTWTVPWTVSETWAFFVAALENSKKTKAWPQRYSTLKSREASLRVGSHVDAFYHLGPSRIRAQYVVKSIKPHRTLVYQTSAEHILQGQSKIEIKSRVGGTQVRWSGHYRSKNLASFPALLWFKLFFERAFFAELKENTHKAKVRALKKAAAA